MAVRKLAAVHLAESVLGWVILRPGTLVDAPGTGQVRGRLANCYGEVPRAMWRRRLRRLSNCPPMGSSIIEVTECGTPVGESVQRFARP